MNGFNPITHTREMIKDSLKNLASLTKTKAFRLVCLLVSSWQQGGRLGGKKLKGVNSTTSKHMTEATWVLETKPRTHERKE